MNMQKFHGLDIEGYESLQRELSHLFPISKEDIWNNIKSRKIWDKPIYKTLLLVSPVVSVHEWNI